MSSETKVWKDGTREWFSNGQLHREGGPAVEYGNGSKLWLIKGKLHREDGPAMMWSDGEHRWYLNDVQYSEDEFNRWQEKKNLNGKLEVAFPSRFKEKKNKI